MIEGYLDIVQYFFKKSISINERDEESNKSLLLVEQTGQLSIMQFLLQNGASIEEEDNDGNTLAILAAFGGELKILEWLCDNIVSMIKKTKKFLLHYFMLLLQIFWK